MTTYLTTRRPSVRKLFWGALLAVCGGVLLPAGASAQTPPPAQVVEYYHTDVLGSVRAVTKNGVVVSRHDFIPPTLARNHASYGEARP